jgi:hypothetical protein
VTLQLTALTIERKWESRTRVNIGSSRFRRRHRISRPTGNELCQKTQKAGVATRILGRSVSADGRNRSATIAILVIRRAATTPVGSTLVVQISGQPMKCWRQRLSNQFT